MAVSPLPRKKSKPKPLAVRAIDTPRLTVDDIAKAIGEKSRWNLMAYRSGRARMPERIRLRLAAFLDGHARRLLALADELRSLREESGDEPGRGD